MKLSALSLYFLVLAATFVNAQYFSAGWEPGQPAPKAEETPSNPASIPKKESPPERLTPSKIAGFFDLTNLLSSPPAVSLFARLGINITERLEGAVERAKIWDDRVPLITDHNFKDLIVNEPLTQQEEQDRTWVIVISVTAGRQDGISKYVDQMFDAAFNETVIAGDLPNVRWGRIDYFNVTGITTKWAIWNAPFLVILRNRGQTLRFYRPHQMRLKESAMRSFLEHEDWKVTPPWSSIYAPGGDREYIMDFLAVVLTKIYDTAILVPRWLLFVISGSIASFLINFLHKPAAARPAQAQRPQQQQQQQSDPGKATPAPSTQVESSATASPSKPPVTKRKKAKGKH
ncbi:hypothetical protein D9615_000708 [Tricholomella constricta]|uniref:Uncharacterized protein n=1 Tax=Tricholomella constricta TaxID=117010 RepID=A0A8H5MBP2_9AGAR|nr:hypothetical protein D9615_000708 [Tricholomella constricta]